MVVEGNGKRQGEGNSVEGDRLYGIFIRLLKVVSEFMCDTKQEKSLFRQEEWSKLLHGGLHFILSRRLFDNISGF